MENNQTIKVVFDLEQRWNFEPITFLDQGDNNRFYAPYQANNDIYQVRVVSDYSRKNMEAKAIELPVEVFERWLAIQQEYNSLNAYFEQMYRGQEGLTPLT